MPAERQTQKDGIDMFQIRTGTLSATGQEVICIFS